MDPDIQSVFSAKGTDFHKIAKVKFKIQSKCHNHEAQPSRGNK